jgi:hypothetical protein
MLQAWGRAQDPTDRIVYAKAKLLCEWKTSRAPPGLPAMQFCEAGENVSSDQAYEQMRGFWDAWYVQNQAAARVAEADFERAAKQAAEERYALADKARDAQKQLDAAENENELALRVRSLKTRELCVEYHASDSPAARAELNRRKAISAQDWQLVDRHTFRIGMTENALICSVGETEENRTVTGRGVHSQYVYGDVYIYVDNGFIVSYQYTHE